MSGAGDNYFVAAGRSLEIVNEIRAESLEQGRKFNALEAEFGMKIVVSDDEFWGFQVPEDEGFELPYSMKIVKSLTPRRGPLSGTRIADAHTGRKAGKELEKRLKATRVDGVGGRFRELFPTANQRGIFLPEDGMRRGTRIVKPGWEGFNFPSEEEVVVFAVPKDADGVVHAPVDAVPMKRSAYWAMCERADELDAAEKAAKAGEVA